MRSLTCRRSYPAFAGKTKDSVWYEVFRRDNGRVDVLRCSDYRVLECPLTAPKQTSLRVPPNVCK